MNFLCSTLCVGTFLALLSSVYGQIDGIDQRDLVEEAEHILVDNAGTNSVPFVAAVSPCKNYVGFAQDPENRGEQTSAQWVRFAFHDFVTHSQSAGTGGLDASLGFEADRDENRGLFVNDTMKFMVSTTSAYMSVSDQINLGILASVTQCGGNARAIPLRVGRIDATAAGPPGVPGPFTPIEPTLAQFASAGFSQTETIGLVACGHSLGGVHRSNFPEIVDESAVTANNLDGRVNFDTTVDVLDGAGMTGYLEQSGTRGGPLVNTPNADARSDFRLFNSDGNATISDLVSNAGRTCAALFTKMINTVPNTVTLSDPITPFTWKAVDIQMHISNGGSVRVSGLFRYLGTMPPGRVQYKFTTKNGTSSTTFTSDPVSGTGWGIFGSTTYWPFARAIDTLPGTTTLNFQGVTYPINDQIFVVPGQSTVKAGEKSVEVKAAVLTSLTSGLGDMTATLYVPTAQQGSQSMKIVPKEYKLQAFTVVGKYTFFKAKTTVTNVENVIAKVSIGDISSRTVKTKLFKNL